MEKNTFVKPAVAEILEQHYVEARLHVDEERFLDLEETLLQSIAQPVYAIVSSDAVIPVGDPNFDPSSVRILSRLDGAKADEFIGFLKKGLQGAAGEPRAQTP